MNFDRWKLAGNPTFGPLVSLHQKRITTPPHGSVYTYARVQRDSKKNLGYISIYLYTRILIWGHHLYTLHGSLRIKYHDRSEVQIIPPRCSVLFVFRRCANGSSYQASYVTLPVQIPELVAYIGFLIDVSRPRPFGNSVFPFGVSVNDSRYIYLCRRFSWMGTWGTGCQALVSPRKLDRVSIETQAASCTHNVRGLLNLQQLAPHFDT